MPAALIISAHAYDDAADTAWHGPRDTLSQTKQKTVEQLTALSDLTGVVCRPAGNVLTHILEHLHNIYEYSSCYDVKTHTQSRDVRRTLRLYKIMA